jgi:hypothetical protein
MKKRSRIFLIILSCIFLWCCSKGLTPEKKALRLVLESHALGGDLSVGDAIERVIREGGDNIKSVGWYVSRIDGRVYLVAYRYNIYSFERGTGERGFFFEVDLGDGSVRNVTEEYTMDMRPLSEPFKDEEEILEEFIEGSDLDI